MDLQIEHPAKFANPCIDCDTDTAPARGSASPARQYTLHRDRSKRALVTVVPDGELYRIRWPDAEPSDLCNLTRAKAAALEWAERNVVLDRKISVARRLKSLTNFRWSSSYVAQNGQGGPKGRGEP